MASQPKNRGAARAAPAPAPAAPAVEAVAKAASPASDQVSVVLAVNATVLHNGSRLTLRAGAQSMPEDLADQLRADGLLVDE